MPIPAVLVTAVIVGELTFELVWVVENPELSVVPRDPVSAGLFDLLY